MQQMSLLNDPLPYSRDMPVGQHCAGYLYTPGSIFPDAVTKRKVIHWANDKYCDLFWHTPWKRRQKNELNYGLENDMKAKYGTLGVTYARFHVESEWKMGESLHVEDQDTNNTRVLPKFSRESIHWPKVY